MATLVWRKIGLKKRKIKLNCVLGTYVIRVYLKVPVHGVHLKFHFFVGPSSKAKEGVDKLANGH